MLIEEYDLGAETWQLTIPGGKVTDVTSEGICKQAEIELRSEWSHRHRANCDGAEGAWLFSLIFIITRFLYLTLTLLFSESILDFTREVRGPGTLGRRSYWVK